MNKKRLVEIEEGDFTGLTRFEKLEMVLSTISLVVVCILPLIGILYAIF